MIVVLKMIFKMNKSASPEVAAFASLSDVRLGETAILGDFDLEDTVADHLMNLGFIPGTEITAAHTGPGGDPRVYRVERTEVALRRDVTDRISVQLLPEKKPVASAVGHAVLILGTTDVSAD